MKFVYLISGLFFLSIFSIVFINLAPRLFPGFWEIIPADIQEIELKNDIERRSIFEVYYLKASYFYKNEFKEISLKIYLKDKSLIDFENKKITIYGLKFYPFFTCYQLGIKVGHVIALIVFLLLGITFVKKFKQFE